MTDATPIAKTRRAALAAGLTPPERLRSLAEWAERHLVLPDTVSASPGRFVALPYQRQILDAVGDPALERITVVSAVRVGKTSALIAGVLGRLLNEPGPAMVLVPTDADARNFVVSDFDQIAAASPATRGLLAMESDARNTLTDRRGGGASLKVRAARSPGNLRAHTVRDLFIDEADAMSVTQEGDPLALAERRTFSYANRKIVTLSTPTDEETSNVLRAYRSSDQRIFEIECPGCRGYFELLWRHVEWPEGEPERAHVVAPCCGTVIDHRDKAAAVARGRWRATAPEVKGHAGFKINALVSPLANAAWGKLAVEFLAAKASPDQIRVFINTILAEGWRASTEQIDPDDLAARAEDWGLDAIPAEVLVLCGGADVQADRVEISVLGFSRDAVLVLGHLVVWGSPEDDSTWAEVDGVLKTTWAHPSGGTLRLDAVVIDSGGSGWTGKVYDFCRARFGRKVLAGKGVSGTRPPLVRSSAKGVPLFLIGVDGLKQTIAQRLARGRTLRFSDRLRGGPYFEQIASEHVVVRYVRGAPVRRWERIPGRAAEALDCCVYGIAARHAVNVNLDQREAELASPAAPKRPPAVIRSRWMEGR